MYLFKVWLHSSQLASRIGGVWRVAVACGGRHSVYVCMVCGNYDLESTAGLPRNTNCTSVPHRTPGNPTTNERTNTRALVVRSIVLTAADCLLRRRLTMVNQSANDTTTTTTTTTTLRRLFIDADDDVIVDGGRRRFGRQQQRRT